MIRMALVQFLGRQTNAGISEDCGRQMHKFRLVNIRTPGQGSMVADGHAVLL